MSGPLFKVERLRTKSGTVAHVVLSGLHPEIPPVIKGSGWEIVTGAPLCGRSAELPAPGGLRDCWECTSLLSQVQRWAEDVGAGVPKVRAGGLDVWLHGDTVEATDPRWREEPWLSLSADQAKELGEALALAAATIHARRRLGGAR